MAKKRPNKLTSDYLVDILARQNLLTSEQIEMVRKTYKRNRSNLLRKAGTRPGIAGTEDQLTAVDVLSAYGFTLEEGEEKILTEDLIMRALAEEVNLPFRKIDTLSLDLDIVTKTIPHSFALKHLAVPVGLIDGKLEVAVCNPFDRIVLEDIRRVTQHEIRPVISTKSDIKKLIGEFYGFKTSIAGAEGQFSSPASVDLGNLEQYVRLRSTEEIQATDQHIKNAVDYLFGYAFEQGGSDIHIEPKREETLIRLRIDGVLHNLYKLPKSIHSAIVSRIKTISGLDIAEKRRPQDGRIKIEHQGREVEVRVSTLPVAFGEKVVLRLLNPEVLFQDLDQLGFTETDFNKYKGFIHEPHGIILITGPTGSGKSTTLYSTLKDISDPSKNITTIEDPIEMIFEDFNQIGVQPAVDITFGNILRNILRQDPDIIMIGEIRDIETAVEAVQAALTGHLVLSTLHTNDAPQAVTRLLDLGIEPFLLSATLLGVVAQRLVKRICPHCREEFIFPKEESAALGLNGLDDVSLFRGAGCEKCRGTGYMGRVPVFEVLHFSEKIKRVALAEKDAGAIRTAALAEGMSGLRENCLKIMKEGLTTFQEVLRITGEG